ncbi:MAG: septum formation initiator family protein [Clostridium sp.]
MSMTNSRRKETETKRKNLYSLIAIMFLVIMSVQIVKLYQKEQEYTAREKALTESLEDETERQNQLDNYEEYTKSQEYIEDQAKSKLGLTHENEIIFKEDKK